MLDSNEASTREINMEKRRQRILSEARRAIAEHGFQELNTRSLAKAAGVSQPTLYNLIGNKDQILLLLISETMKTLDGRWDKIPDVDAVTMAEVIANESTTLFRNDESFYRGALIANEYFSDQEIVWGKKGYFTRWALPLTISIYQKALATGTTKGQIKAEDLAEQTLAAVRVASRDWALRLITIDQFRAQMLRSMYIALAADAKPALHKRLLDKLNAL